MDDREAIARLKEAHGRIRSEIRKVIIGQEDLVDRVLVAVFAGGHVAGARNIPVQVLSRRLAELGRDAEGLGTDRLVLEATRVGDDPGVEADGGVVGQIGLAE